MKMGPKTQQAFDFFVEHANKSGLHSLDWGRFYRFVHIAHRYRSQMWEQDIKQALVEAGFFEDHARYLSDVYTHCWRMLGNASPMEAKERRLGIKDEYRLSEEVRRRVEGRSLSILEIKEVRRQVEKEYFREVDEKLLLQIAERTNS